MAGALSRTSRRATALVLAGYLVGALIVTWRLWADPASSYVAPNAGDADLFAWYLRYAATAVGHGHLPALATSAMNAPSGVNMMWNTSLLLPGVLMTPVTLLLGPQVSLAVLVTAGFAGSAAAMFVVLRRWQVNLGAAALAGAVYGFSPALVQSAVGHYNLQLAILPPLIVDAGVRIAVGRPPSARSAEAEPPAARSSQAGPPAARPSDARPSAAGTPDLAGLLAMIPAPVVAGTRLGVLVAAQLFISEEVALSSAIAGILFVAGLALARPRAVPRRILPAAAGLVTAGLVTLALAGHALLVQFHGPHVQHGPLYPLDFYVNEPSGFVTPSALQFFHTGGSAAIAASYHAGLTEYLAYLGWPLIVALAVAAVAAWRRPAGVAAAFSLIVLVVFSFGGHPETAGVPNPAVSLPWHWLEEHQLLSSVLPDRLSIVADGVAAVLLAVGIDVIAGRLNSRHHTGGVTSREPEEGEFSPPSSRPRPQAIVLAVAVLACLPLLPRPLPAGTVEPLPAGWTAVFTALRLRPSATVLVVPVPTNILPLPMRWQADSGQPRNFVGGYFIGPGAGGQAYLGGFGVTKTAWYLDQLWAAGLPRASLFAEYAQAAGLAVAGPAGAAKAGPVPPAPVIRADLASWHPAAVVAVTAPGSPLARFLVARFGQPSVRARDVLAWRP